MVHYDMRANFEAYGQRVEVALHNLTDVISYEIASTERFYEQDALFHIASTHRFNGLIVDVGANIGNHALFLSKFTNYNRMVCFEPQLDNFALLQENTKHDARITCLDKAAGPHECYVSMVGGNSVNMGMFKAMQLDSVQGNTQMVALDSLQLQDVSLMKIDVEGGELGVLIGAASTIRVWKPDIYLEATELEELSKVLKFLRELAGYVCVQHVDNRLFEFKALKFQA